MTLITGNVAPACWRNTPVIGVIFIKTHSWKSKIRNAIRTCVHATAAAKWRLYVKNNRFKRESQKIENPASYNRVRNLIQVFILLYLYIHTVTYIHIHRHIYIHMHIYIQKHIPHMGPGPCRVCVFVCISAYGCIYVYVTCMYVVVRVYKYSKIKT